MINTILTVKTYEITTGKASRLENSTYNKIVLYVDSVPHKEKKDCLDLFWTL